MYIVHVKFELIYYEKNTLKKSELRSVTQVLTIFYDNYYGQ